MQIGDVNNIVKLLSKLVTNSLTTDEAQAINSITFQGVQGIMP
jgi:hypothetical protein